MNELPWYNNEELRNKYWKFDWGCNG